MPSSDQAEHSAWIVERSPSGDTPLLATAIHQGHALRAELQPLVALSGDERLREEDPYTDRWAKVAATRVVVERSRFEVDLNRPPESCVYLQPADAWGLQVWQSPLPAEVVERSRALHARFYTEMRELLDELIARHGRIVVFDLHSYNHRRGGPTAPPADPEANPIINLGTGSMDLGCWEPIVSAFERAMAGCRLDGRPIDVRRNVKFQGGWWSRWLHQTYPGRVCALAIEAKKVFMDEWTGRLDPERHTAIGQALETSAAAVLESLAELPGAD